MCSTFGNYTVFSVVTYIRKRLAGAESRAFYMTLFKDKKLLAAAGLVVNKQFAKERKLIVSLEKEYDSIFLSKDYCSEDRKDLLESISFQLFNALLIHEQNYSHRGSIIEKTYDEMEQVRSMRRYNNRTTSFDYKKDSDAYGIATFWDGFKDAFFIIDGFIYFLVCKECYPLYLFEGDHSDCSLKYIKGRNASVSND